MRRAVLMAFSTAVLTTACTEAPFVDRTVNSTTDKPISTVLEKGSVEICYSGNAAWNEVQKAADDACGDFGYFAELSRVQKWQCRVTAPHRAEFSCRHPDMLDENGVRINPSNATAVAAWQKRTGKMLPKRREALPAALQSQPRSAAPLPGMPNAHPAESAAGEAAPQTPAAAPPEYARPLTPADIAGKPGFEPAPLILDPNSTQSLTAPQGAAPAGGFNLPIESWGRHFEE